MAQRKRRPPAKRKAKAKEPKPVPAAGDEGLLPFEPEPEPPPAATALADGTLLRADGDPVVYLMDRGLRRPFANAAAFDACGFGWGDIVVKPPEEVERIFVGRDVGGLRDL